MVQHVMIRLDDETNLAVIAPGDANIWTDDQEIMWSIIDDRLEWDNANFPNRAVIFGPEWKGSTPEPVGPPVIPDRRPYVATGPGPASQLPWGSGMAKFTYEAHVTASGTGLSFKALTRDDMIDPDISNQPHPP
jgi:hypothetical protein